MRRLVALGMLLLPSMLAADEIYLKSGGHLSGMVIEERDGLLVLEVAPGRISVPRSHVERIVPGSSPLATFRDRAARLRSNDTAGWVELAIWAEERELTTQARQAFEHVLMFEPTNAVAQRGIGHVELGDRWVTPEENYRARGYVFFDGAWISPEERQGILAERAAQVAASRAREEADARVREAEARARTAEAEARRAEAGARAEQAQAQQGSNGIPYPWVFGGSPVFGGGPVFTAVPTFSTLGVVPGIVTAPGIISPFPGFVSSRRHFPATQVIVNVRGHSQTPCPNPAPVPTVPRGSFAGLQAARH